MGILSITNDPRMIVEKHGRMQTNFLWLLRQYLEEKLEAAKIGDESRNNTAALISFRREKWDDSYDKRENLPGLGILIWAPSNYISVYKKFGELPGFGHQFDWGGWEFVTSHDSCWVNSMEDIIRSEEDTIGLLCLLPAVKTLKLGEKQVELLRELKRKAQEWR